MSAHLEPEQPYDGEKTMHTQVNTLPLSDDTDSLGHTPELSRRAKMRQVGKSLITKEGWFGDYVSFVSSCALHGPCFALFKAPAYKLPTQDYAALFIPNIPYLVKTKRELPFYGVNDKLPWMLMFILGLQQ